MTEKSQKKSARSLYPFERPRYAYKVLCCIEKPEIRIFEKTERPSWNKVDKECIWWRVEKKHWIKGGKEKGGGKEEEGKTSLSF